MMPTETDISRRSQHKEGNLLKVVKFFVAFYDIFRPLKQEKPFELRDNRKSSFSQNVITAVFCADVFIVFVETVKRK